jgi:hypothetical protein
MSRKLVLSALSFGLCALSAVPALSQPVHYWTGSQSYPTAGSTSTFVDSQGDVFVGNPSNTGTQSPSVVKFTPDGQVAWIGYGPLEPAGDCIGIKQTPEGGILVGMHHQVNDFRTDSTLQKFSSTGVLQWYKYNTTNLISFDIDKAGNIYQDFGHYIVKRKPNGATVWTATPAGVQQSFDDFVPDQQGGVYAGISDFATNAAYFSHVTGAGPVSVVQGTYGFKMIACPGGGFYQFNSKGCARADANMNVLWTVVYPLPGQFDEFLNFAVDAKGNTIALGEMNGSPYTDFIYKYDINGNSVYQKTFAGGMYPNGFTDLMDLTTNANGDAFALVRVTNAFTSNDVEDMAIIRYDPQGNLVWPLSGGIFYNGAIMFNSGATDMSAGIGLDHLGNVLLGGVSTGGPQFQIVAAKYGPLHNSDFVSQSVPLLMIKGQTYQVSLTFQNAGLSTWTAADGFSLESRNGTANTTWGLSHVQLGALESIAPGQNKTFTFNVTAPAVAGHYNFQWKVVKTGTGGIGVPSKNLSITVATSG